MFNKDKIFFDFIENKSIALIGPAATLEDSNLGSRIDSYDIVARLNHHLVVEGEIAKDYGSRNDMIFSDPNLEYCYYQILEEVQPKFICFPRPNCLGFDTYNEIIERVNKKYPYVHLYHVGDNFGRKIEKELGTSPNTGILAISFLLSCKIKHLFVGGFDFYQNKKTYYKNVKKRMLENKHYETEVNKYGYVKTILEHNQEKIFSYFYRLFIKNRGILEVDDELYKMLSSSNIIR